MKKFLSFVFIVSVLFSNAQHRTKSIRHNVNSSSRETVAPPNTLYSFSTFTAPYQAITGPTLTGGLKWDDISFSIPLGFNFKLYNEQNDSIYFSEGSYASFQDVNASILTIASPMFEDLCDRAYYPNTDTLDGPGGISHISYTITGVAPNRAAVIQVANAGFYGELAGFDTSASFVNFQLWLYEGSWDIEFKFGNTHILNPADIFANAAGFLCGLAEDVNIFTGAMLSSNALQGAHNTPTMVALSQNVSEVLTGTPASGRGYRFTRFHPNPVAIDVAEQLPELSFYPNPASKTLYCKGLSEQMKNATINFYGFDGKLLLSKELSSQTDVTLLPSGIYLVKVRDQVNNEICRTKLVVAE